MRHFVVHGHDAPTDADVELDKLASGAGRLDLLARSLLAGLLLSHDVRDDTTVHLVHADELTLSFVGGEIRSLHPDERSAAALVRSVLTHSEEAVGRVPVEASPGIEIRGVGFEETVRSVAKEATLVHLDPAGEPATLVEPPDAVGFVLSGNRPFTDAEAAFLADACDRRLSVGPHALHTDQSIAVAHNWCDTNGWTEW